MAVPNRTPPDLATEFTDGTVRPGVLAPALADHGYWLNNLYPRVGTLEANATTLTSTVDSNVGRAKGLVPASSAVATGEAKLYWDPATLQLKLKGKDSLGAVSSQTVGVGSSAIGSVIVADSVQGDSVALDTTTYTKNAWQDFQNLGTAAAPNVVPMRVAFVAPCDVVEVELVIPPMFVFSGTALVNPILWRVAVTGIGVALEASSGQVPASPTTTATQQASQLYAVVQGNTYTMRVQVFLPNAMTTQVVHVGNVSGFAVGTVNDEKRFAVRVKGVA